MKKLIDVIGKNKNEYVFTAITLIKEEKDLYNQEIVKTVVDKNNYVLYFSRSLIPYPKIYFMEKNLTKNKEVFFYKLAGISIFRKNFLLKFSSLPFSNLENIEKIEYLRIIENGYKIKVVKI